MFEDRAEVFTTGLSIGNAASSSSIVSLRILPSRSALSTVVESLARTFFLPLPADTASMQALLSLLASVGLPVNAPCDFSRVMSLGLLMVV